MNISSMAALGSSFAAGPGLPDVVDRRAMRSERNYAHLPAKALGARLIDATISSATTDTILTVPQRVGVTRFPPQLESIDPTLDLDLVTITAGGNDLDYLGSMLKTAVADLLSRQRILGPFGRNMRAGNLMPVTDQQVEKVATGLIQIVEEVAKRAPQARILLVDYLTVIGPATQASRAVPFTDAELLNFCNTRARLAEAFQSAERESAGELVKVSGLSEDHAVDAIEPWVNGFQPSLRRATIGSSFHPNAAGMQAVSNAILGHL